MNVYRLKRPILLMLILRKRINLKLFNLMATVSVIVYIGEMRRCLKKRMMEHRLALKCCNSNNGVAAHAWVESHTVNWEGAEIRGIQPNKWKKILQAIHIHPHTSNLVCRSSADIPLIQAIWYVVRNQPYSTPHHGSLCVAGYHFRCT